MGWNGKSTQINCNDQYPTSILPKHIGSFHLNMWQSTQIVDEHSLEIHLQIHLKLPLTFVFNNVN